MTAYREIPPPQSFPPDTSPLLLIERVPFLLHQFPSLDPPVEWPRYCFVCESEQTFKAGWECDAGLVGCCLGCGDERVARFTRVNGEAV